MSSSVGGESAKKSSTSPTRKSVKVVSYTLHSSSSSISQPAVCAPAAYVMPGSPNESRLEEPPRLMRGPLRGGNLTDRASFNIPELHSPSGK